MRFTSFLSNCVERFMLTFIINRNKLFGKCCGRLFSKAKVYRPAVLHFCKTVYYALLSLVQCIVERRAITMKIIAIIIVSFLGLGFLVHICSKNNYTIEYSSNKRKIKICSAKQDKSFHKTSKGQR